MKKNTILINVASASVGLVFLVACATPVAKHGVTASPSPSVIVADTAKRAQLSVSFHVPGHYLSKRSRIVISPQLMAGDTIIGESLPIAVYSPIYSKKTERRCVLEGYEDPYKGRTVHADDVSREIVVPFSDTFFLPDGVDTARVVAVVSTDGCGECTGIDTVYVATIAMPVVKDELNLSWIEPEFKVRPKIMHGKGEARLQFVINKYDINLDMGNNRSELEDMMEKLAPVVGDTLATLTSLDIFGMASADGPLSFNTPLSRNRANAAKGWLVERLGITPEVQRVIKIGSRPEGWQPVLEAMIADGHPDADKVAEILARYASENDDVAERYIRRLACWKDIREKYLQKDRKVEYAYTYNIRSFTTDAELIEMYKKRPDAFNEDELLRVASLAADDESRKSVYLTLMKYYPQSVVGANNLAVLYQREGNIEEAKRVLARQKEHSKQ